MLQSKNTLFKNIVSASAIVLTSNILLKVVGFAATLLLLNAISVYDYGLWRLLLSILTLAGIATLPGLDSVISTDLGREAGVGNYARYKTLFLKAAALFFCLGVLVAVVLFFIAPILTQITGINITLPVRILAVCVLTSALVRIYGWAFSTNLHFFRAQSITFLNSALYLIFLGIFVWHLHMGLVGVALAYALASGICVVAFLPLVWSVLKPYMSGAGDVTYSLWGMIRGHGKWSLVSDYADTIIGSMKPWILGYFVSIEAVGIFAAAVTLLSLLSNILPLNQVLSAVLPRESHNAQKTVFFANRSIKYTVWAYALMAAGVVAVGPILIPILLPKYEAAIPLLSVLLLTLAILPYSDISSTMLNILKAQKRTFAANTFARVVSVCMVLPVATRLLGVWGAVIDQILTTYLIVLGRVWFVRKDLPEFGPKMRDLFVVDAYDREAFARLIRGARQLI